MRIDERALDELIVESQDLQVDALRDTKATIPDLIELREQRRGEPVDPEHVARFNLGRRSLLKRLGAMGGGVAGVGLLGGGIGTAMASLLAQPAAADQALDVQILQTASSLERLAVNTYGTALTLPFIKSGNAVIVKFAQTTMMQHDEHRKAFQAQTTALGGKVQDTPNPKYAPIVAAAAPTLKAALDVVKLAMTLETVARDTYLADLVMFSDNKSLQIMSTVMGVETQHLATLRAVAALIQGGAPQLIAIPLTNLAALPAAAGSVAFSDGPFPMPTMASPPTEGAVQ
ncbi:MAG: ferritin-like domain-containing protein [Actinomycetota bacterium]|nr:ferritin-like domain-containing protein [Actinomycetota bacterium]